MTSIMLIGCKGDESAEVDSESAPPTKIETVVEKEEENSSSHLYIGTGSVQGVYFPIGGVICRLLNRHKTQHNIRCTLESTGGSINNLRELRDGTFDIVVAQSDWHYHAYNGSSTFAKDGANDELRSVFALEADPLAMIVKRDSDIQTFDDLAGKAVSLGYSRSLQHRIMDDYMEVKGWDEEQFKQVVLMGDAKQVAALCSDQVDAILLLSSSLTDHLSSIPEDCQMRLLPFEDADVETVIKKYPYYRTGIIPRGMHLDSQDDTHSFGLGATFVALESTSPKAIYYVVKEIVENFKDFKSLHPSLQTISKEELPKAGLTAPLHPGAVRYYREARLLN